MHDEWLIDNQVKAKRFLKDVAGKRPGITLFQQSISEEQYEKCLTFLNGFGMTENGWFDKPFLIRLDWLVVFCTFCTRVRPSFILLLLMPTTEEKKAT